MWETIWRGRDGVRAGWRVALFLVLVGVLLLGFGVVASRLRLVALVPGALTPGFITVNELLLLGPVAMASWVMVRLEGRGFASCGFTGRWLWPVLLGFAVALVLQGGIMALLWGTGHASFVWGGLGLRAGLGYALAWGWASLLTGLAEEFAFRGYLLQILGKGLGFPGALIVTSLLFGGLHFANTGEGLFGMVSAGLGGAIMALAVRRTGALWWAIGFHGGWDYMENFLAGTPDSGELCAGALLRTLPHGATWLSGGATGPEGSVFTLALLSLVFAAAWRFFPPHTAATH